MLDTSDIRLLLTVESLATDNGGPSRSVTRLATALARQGAEITVAFRDDGRPQLVPDTSEFLLAPFRARSAMRALPYAAHLRRVMQARCINLVCDFGLWLPENIASHASARSLRLPWLCSPRGLLEPWSRAHKSWKKTLAWGLYQRRILQRAQALVVTSREEGDNAAAVLPEVSRWLVPNGVELPPWPPAWPRAAMRQAVLMSRLHPKKRADLLIQAWARLKPKGWKLVIAGPGPEDYRRELRTLIASAGAQVQIELRDAVEGAEKSRLLFESELFVLPTMSENFGLVIAEALAHGLPVITTTGTPWTQLVERDCGWLIEPEAAALTACLDRAVALPAQALTQMGARGRELASEYSWDASARAFLARCADLPVSR